MTVYPKNSVLTATTPIPKYPIHWFLNAFSNCGSRITKNSESSTLVIAFMEKESLT